jgi:hypothetical protein
MTVSRGGNDPRCLGLHSGNMCGTVQFDPDLPDIGRRLGRWNGFGRGGGLMSERNGDRALFQKNRQRKLRHRQRIRALVTGLRNRTVASASADRSVTVTFTDARSVRASLTMHDDRGPERTSD